MRRFLSCLLVITGALALLPGWASALPGPGQVPWPADAAPGRLIVATDDALAADALAATPAVGDTAVLTAGVVALRVPAGSETGHAAALRELAGVQSVEPDWLVRTHATPVDARFSDQWSHHRTGAPLAWDIRTDATSARIAVIDTGMHGGHPDLAGHISEQVDLSTGEPAGPAQTGVDNDTCLRGHGTQVAGVAAAAGNNGRDIAGVAWQADLLDISVASTREGAECHSISMSAIVAGIDYAVRGTTRPASVISISMGGFSGRCPSSMQTAIDMAWSAGTVIVASAGNGEREEDTAGKLSFPASCDKVISVAATGPTDERAPYSQRNTAVDIAAPGGDVDHDDGAIVTTHRNVPLISTVAVQGTSFSAPYVAGVLALMRAERADLEPAVVVGLLLETAKDLGPAGKDSSYGAGLVQPAAALAAVQAYRAEQAVGGDSGDSGGGGGDSGGGVSGGGETEQPEPEPSETPAPEPTPAPAPAVSRVSSGAERTEPVAQAVAVSELAFARSGAAHAVIARADDYADALAGSALGMGEGPLLFARGAELPEATREELRRVLPAGETVYLLGGPAALPAELEQQLVTLGFVPKRLSGATREDTAARVAAEVLRRAEELGRTWSGRVILATRGDWPDAVSAGSVAALLPAPVLLTSPDQLHPSTRAALEQLRPSRLLVVGGTRAVSESVAAEAAASAGARLQRLSGAARDATAVAIAREAHRLLGTRDSVPRYAVAVNLRRADGFAHALSASALSGVHGALLLPVEGEDGSQLPDVVRDWAAGELGDPSTDVLLAGEDDIIAADVGEELGQLLAQARAARAG